MDLTFPKIRSLPKAFYNFVLKNFYDNFLTQLTTINKNNMFLFIPKDQVPYSPTLFHHNIYTLHYPPLFFPLYLGFWTHFWKEVMEEKNKIKYFAIVCSLKAKKQGFFFANFRKLKNKDFIFLETLKTKKQGFYFFADFKS